MQEVDGFTTAIAAAVEEQGAATEEISRNVQMAARGTEDLTQNVAGVTGAIGETSRAAQDVLDVSGRLGSHANALKRRGGPVPQRRSRRRSGAAAIRHR